jgi:DNA-binding XRE family transcriptional regulator
MTIGYSQSVAFANRHANIKSLGVALGRACIEKGVGVRAVAEHFGVSRQAIYNWFKGDCVPDPSLHTRIERYIAKITKK